MATTKCLEKMDQRYDKEERSSWGEVGICLGHHVIKLPSQWRARISRNILHSKLTDMLIRKPNRNQELIIQMHCIVLATRIGETCHRRIQS